MLKLSIDRSKQEIEMQGPLLDLLNDALNAVGILSREFEKVGGKSAAAMFIAGIPKAIIEYRSIKSKEEQHENDTL